MQRNKGGAQGRGVKIKPGLPGLKLPAEKGPTDKPLAGKVFYLDVTSKLLSENFEKDIKVLGGTVEGFLSKEISCLITSKKEAKCTKSLQYSCSLSSPEPAQNTGSASARPGSRRGGTQEGGSNKKPTKDDVSRGKSLLKKVIKEQEILQKNSILANAWNWGVEILHVDDAKTYLETKKRLFIPVKQPEAVSKPVVKQSHRYQPRAQKLKSPFIKVEDCSNRYRPIYLVLPCFRSFQSPPPPPPPKQCKSAKKAATTNKATGTKQGLNKTWHGQDAGNIQKQGYCECCLKKYNDLEDHVTGTQHHMFSLGPHYQDVDHLISKFEFDFVDWSVVSQEAVKRSVLMPTVAVDWKEKKIADEHKQFSSGLHLSDLELFQPRQRMEPEVLHAATDCPGNTFQSPEPGFYPLCPVRTVRNDAMGTDYFSVPPGTPAFLPYTDKTLHLAGSALSAYLADMYSPPHTPQGPTPGPSVAAMPMESSSPEPGSECLTVALANSYKSLNPVGETITAYEHMHSPIQTPQGPNLGLSVAATPIAQSSPEPGNECPSKRIKLDSSLASVTLYSVPVEADNVTSPKPVIDAVPEAMEPACLLNHSEALHGQSPHGSPTKLHRKVKPLVRKVKQDEPCVPPACKVSVPEEGCDLSSSEKRLLALFETSEVQSEFCGFPCRSESFPHTIDAKEDPLSYKRDFLWCCFSNTGSSGTTFEGF